MDLSCPACGARYRIDADCRPEAGAPAAEARPRRVRCRVCHTVFAAVPGAEDPENGDKTGDENGAEEGEAPPPRRRWPLLAGAGAVLALAAGLILAISASGGALGPGRALNWQALHWPALNWQALPFSLSSALPRAPRSPLQIELDPGHASIDGKRRILALAGHIRNPTAGAVAVPAIELQLLDREGRILARQTIRPFDGDSAGRDFAGSALAGSESRRFETSLVDPPPETHRVRAILKPAELARP